MNGDEIGYEELYLFVSLGISIGSRLNRFAVCNSFSSPFPSIQERQVIFGGKRLKCEGKSVEQNKFVWIFEYIHRSQRSLEWCGVVPI